MKKMLSLIKACMSSDMSLFKIKSKNKSSISKIALPVVLFLLVFIAIYGYSSIIMDELVKYDLGYVLLTLFLAITTILTLVEGVYKSGSLIFNCKDDNLLLSLPIKKSTVLFIRIFKFYVFEFLYNILLLLPAIIVYANYISVTGSYYVVSAVMLLLLPIIPIIISSIIGMIVSGISSKFKLKNIIQIIITMAFLVVIMAFSFNFENNITKIASYGEKINSVITKFYYPADAFVRLVTNFNLKELILFIIINISLFILSIILLSNIYYKINSNIKVIKKSKGTGEYKVKKRSIMNSLIMKELNKFISTPVFVINAGFGLVLFVIICIAIVFKFDSFVSSILSNSEIKISASFIYSIIPVVLFGLIALTSFMSSITSSMISLEGKSFNILKSLPIKPAKIIVSKVLAAVIIMIPFLLLGNIMFFIKFRFDLISIVINLIASFVFPFISEMIGILLNLKYPKMDAENDTEVVKQSMSSGIAVILGIILVIITTSILSLLVFLNINAHLIIFISLLFYIGICALLSLYLNKSAVKDFNNINV